MIMIFFNIIILSNNMIEYKFSNITLKIQGYGDNNILSSEFSSNYYPDIIYINEKQNETITNKYYFNKYNNIMNLIWNNSIDNCANMFKYCSNIIEIDLSNFDTSNVTNMSSMFNGCETLSLLNLSNFNTSNVINMNYMFQGCKQLSLLDLSNFDTSKITNMNYMFQGCKQLSLLNLSNFDTSKVTNMEHMFQGCSKLSLLDLSNFDTSNVTNMNSMFSGCEQLSSLNLSNFDTSKVRDMSHMFYYCLKLEYINLNIFTEISLPTASSTYNMFNKVPDNVVVCLNQNSNKIKKEIMNKNCYSIDCTDNWELNQKKLVNKDDLCYDYSNNGILYNYKYQGLYYESCVNRNLTNNKTINYCKCDNEECISCSNVSVIGNFYEIENDTILNGYKKCYKDPIGYYLDTNESIYKKCYDSCKKCKIKGNNIIHNCIECNKDNQVKIIMDNHYFNCLPNNTHSSTTENSIYEGSHNSIFPSEYSIPEENKCPKYDEIKKILEDLINNKTMKEEETKYYDTILEYIEDIMTSNKYNTSALDGGNDEIIKTEKVKVIISTSENQKNNIDNNATTVDLGECENSLRQSYNLLDNETVYIKMLEIYQEGMRIPKVEYDIYAKLNGSLEKLNLNSCQNNKISLLIPVDNVGTLDKLNSKSGYYNDFCYTATSDNGTDISLEDRKNEYPSKTVCQDDCDFVTYNYTTKKAKCSCEAKKSSSSFADMKIDINIIIRKF